MRYDSIKEIPTPLPPEVDAQTMEKFVVTDGDRVVLYAGVVWESLIPRHAYLWLVPVDIRRGDLRGLRRMVAGLPLDRASAIIDTSQRHLVKWIEFLGFTAGPTQGKGKRLYRRYYGDGTSSRG